MFTVKIPPQAKRKLKQIPAQYKKAVMLALDELKEYPLAGKPLQRELNGSFTYKVNLQNKVVTILTAGHRATIYS